MTQYAKFQSRSAWLGTEFGESYARRLFGDEVVDSLPRYVRGKSVGKFKADVSWLKCIEGGWIKTGYDHMREESVGLVENRRGKVIVAILRTKDGNLVATYGDNGLLHVIAD